MENVTKRGCDFHDFPAFSGNIVHVVDAYVQVNGRQKDLILLWAGWCFENNFTTPVLAEVKSEGVNGGLFEYGPGRGIFLSPPRSQCLVDRTPGRREGAHFSSFS